MGKRIVFLLILNVGIILVSLGVISNLSINASIDRSLENRIALAHNIGKYVDHVLEGNLKRLYDISLSGRVDFRDGDWGPEKRALKGAIEYSLFTGRIFLLDRQGRVVLSYPHQEDAGLDMRSIPYVARTLRELKPVISDVYTLPATQRSLIFALVPLKDKDGEVVGVAGGEIDPTSYLLADFIGTIPEGTKTYIELIDSHGVIVASNDPRRILTCSDRYKVLTGLMAEKRATVINCHRCKESAPEGRQEKEMVAFAPLTMAPWGIIVRDPQDAVFSPSVSLRKGFLILSLIAVGTTTMLAMGMSRSILRPVRSLIAATQRIAEGKLDDPIASESGDEIGTLSRSFDAMRRELARSLESIRRHSDELESRVAERTRELERSREKLSVLLQEIISAEEEERKRIARELHDDTSQSLNALLISLDEISLRFPSYDPVRKQLMALREQCLAMLKGLHRMIRDLRPPVLDDLGLESAIRWVLERHIGERGGRFTFDAMGDGAVLKDRANGVLDWPRVELVLFRVAQEAIINVSRHAEAQNVHVSLSYEDSGIVMEIADDGKGFDAAGAFETYREGHLKGLGLLGMEERISLLDGTLAVRSEPGQGTTVRVTVPVPA